MVAWLKQYRDLVITVALLAIPFFVYLVYAKQGRNLNVADRLVLQATGPLEKYVTSGVEWAQDRWGDYVALREVRHQNLELREDLLRLRAETVQIEELKQENDRLRTALEFSKQIALSTVVAPVIAIGGTLNFLSLTIGRGDHDGIRKGMAVVTPLGVVGKVEATGASYAQVLLLTDVISSVAVESQRSRARATVKGRGDNKVCKLELAERAALFEEGDMLITTGTDGVFPKGLAVGRVSNIEKKGKTYSLSADVLPAVSFATIEEVQVVTGMPLTGPQGSTSASVDAALLKAAAGVRQ